MRPLNDRLRWMERDSILSESKEGRSFEEVANVCECLAAEEVCLTVRPGVSRVVSPHPSGTLAIIRLGVGGGDFNVQVVIFLDASDELGTLETRYLVKLARADLKA